MLTLLDLQKMRLVAAQASEDPTGAMQQMLELLLPSLPAPTARLVYEVLLKVNPEEIVDDYNMPLDHRTN